jgi:MoaA/NifB/PqqE/SkfB family radical SAM enzyme
MITQPIEILKVGHIKFSKDPNLFYVLYPPTFSCNYRCDYCDFFSDNDFISWNIKDKIINFINFLGTKKNVLVQLYGGEPTIDPDILKIVNKIVPYIRLYTNLSSSSDLYKEIITNKNGKLCITSSFHPLKVNFEKFDKNIEEIMKTNIDLLKIKIMADSRKKEECFDIFNYFDKKYDGFNNCEVYLNLISRNMKNDHGSNWKPEELPQYLLTQQKVKDIELRYKYVGDGIIREEVLPYNEVLYTLHDENNYYKCFVGKNGIYINPYGKVSYCKFTTNKVVFDVEDSKEKFLPILEKEIVCPFLGFCCDFEVPKEKICKRIKSKTNQYVTSFVSKEY